MLSYGEVVDDGEMVNLEWRPLDVFDVVLDTVKFSSVSAVVAAIRNR